MDHLLSQIRLAVLFAAFQLVCSNSTHGQSANLLTQDGFTISYTASKISSSKKTDSYSIIITVQTPAADSYFTVHKTGNPLSDLNVDRYAKIEVLNHAGLFKSGERHLTAEPANLIAADNSTAYVIRRGPHTDSFTIDVLVGKVPELRASLIATIQPFDKIAFIKASDAELFAGTRSNGRMFVVYRAIDTLVDYRSNAFASWITTAGRGWPLTSTNSSSFRSTIRRRTRPPRPSGISIGTIRNYSPG